MVKLELLKKKLKDSGKTMTAIAEDSGIVRETLYNRLKGIGEFTASEVVALTITLNLTKKERDDIFLAK